MIKYLYVILFVLLVTGFVSADQNLWNTVVFDKPNNLVKYHAFYQFDDTSLKGVGKNKDIPIMFVYDVQALPYNLTYGTVDYCNFSINHFKNIYDNEGFLVNSTNEAQSVYFSTAGFTTGSITVNMRSSDYLTADMSCHYTDNRSLYQENALIGRFTTFLPSFECDKCTQYSLEQLSSMQEKNDALSDNALGMYDKIQLVVDWNYTFWIILSWVIKVFALLLCVGLIFSGVYYFYIYLKDMGSRS